jgi:hypothetical protein
VIEGSFDIVLDSVCNIVLPLVVNTFVVSVVDDATAEYIDGAGNIEAFVCLEVFVDVEPLDVGTLVVVCVPSVVGILGSRFIALRVESMYCASSA